MDQPVFRVNGKDYPIITLDQWDLGEVCDAEQHFGVDFADDKPNARTSVACLYISIRRLDPTVTVEDIRALPLETIAGIARTFEEALEGDASPPAGEAEPNASENTEPSSPASSNGSADSAHLPSPIGSPGSATGSTSVPATSEETAPAAA